MSVAFDARRGLIVVPTRISGPSGDVVALLALDTGATTTLLNWGIAVMLGYDPAATPNRLQVTTGSGVEFVPEITLHSLAALGRVRQSFPALCHTLPPSATVDGVLGLDFLRDERLVVDFRRGEVVLE